MNFYQTTTRLLLPMLGSILVALVIVPATVSSATLIGQDGEAPRASRTSKAARRKTVIRQTSPATCGPAVLATLLTVWFDDPVTEEEMMKLAGTDKHTVSSLKQLATACVAKKNYKAEGRRWNLPRLLREIDTSGVPVITHLKVPTEHYVLVVGRAGGYLLVSDPDRGEVTIHRTDFLRRWDGFVLVVRSSRPVDNTLAALRKRSAERRLRTLTRANSLTSTTRF